MATSSLLEQLANTTTNFAIASIMLAILTAIFMQALYEIGLRAFLQRWWVNDWLQQRLMNPEYITYKKTGIQEDAKKILMGLEGKARDKSIYSLNYQQLCGQIASSVQREIDEPSKSELLPVFALGADEGDIKKLRFMKESNEYGEGSKKTRVSRIKEDTGETRERVSFYAERGVDDLQIYLGRLWRRNNYLLNLLFSIGLTLFLSLLSTDFVLQFTELTGVLLSVGVVSGLFAPIASNVLERVFYPR